MTDAIKDQNHVPVWLGVLCTDGVTLVPIAIDGATGYFKTDSLSTISFTPNQVALRDANYRHVLMGVDSTDDTKLCPVYVNASGAVLVGS
jgi:hypothetical protein